jgi:hypothetical protein
MHVGLGTFDVIMKIVAEELDMRDGGRCNFRLGEVTREENECNISDIFCVA